LKEGNVYSFQEGKRSIGESSRGLLKSPLEKYRYKQNNKNSADLNSSPTLGGILEELDKRLEAPN
jgi:hypothetical protein